MGMSIEGCIHKLDFSIKAYQKMIDEHVSDGQVVGTGVRGEWSSNTPLNEAYQSHIDAYKMAIDTMRKYQKIAEIVTNNELEWGNTSVRANALLEVKKVVEDGKDT